MEAAFEVRIWGPGMAEPGDLEPLVEPIVLDRDRLGVSDASVSREPNAPVIRPLNTIHVQLTVPDRSARRAWVQSGVHFDHLQRFVAPNATGYSVRPPQLSQPGRAARGPNGSLALLEAVSAGQRRNVLVELPRLQIIPAGAQLRVDAPCIILVGPAAVQITPSEAMSPDMALVDPMDARRWSLPTAQLELWTEELDAFDDVPAPASSAKYYCPEAVASSTEGGARPLEPIKMKGKALIELSTQLLTRLKRRTVFYPLIEEDGTPRLALAYRRPADNAIRTLVSDAAPDDWLEGLLLRLEESDAVPVSASQIPQGYASVPPISVRQAPDQNGNDGKPTILPGARSNYPPSVTVPPSANGLSFPAHVAAQAEQAWQYGQLPHPEELNLQQTNALHRATLLCLQSTQTRELWPPALSAEWTRLFEPNWSNVEGGRALVELTRELGLDPDDGEQRNDVLKLVGEGR